MLRKIRVIIAWVVFVAALLLVVDMTGALHKWLGWVAKVQLIPAILAGSIIALVAVGLLTLLFGRVYCSVLCPLGAVQDGVSWLSGRRKGKKSRFRYSRPKSWLRYVVLTLYVAAGLLGIGVVVSLLDPWAIFGRTTASFLAPLWGWGNNALAWVSEHVGSYAFYPREVFVRSWIVFAVTAATLIVIAVLAWRKGRLWCNSVCPVGTLLGEVSRVAPFRMRFDEGKCTKCGVCEKKCRAQCIDSDNQTIDRSRCVVCFDCVESCKFDAMKYNYKLRITNYESATQNKKETVSTGRRNFLSVVALLAVGTAKAQRPLVNVDGGLADIEDKKRPVRRNPVVPPGSKGAKNITQHCTACQLCVTACPNKILTPSTKLDTFMQPEMTFERGYCRPECVECGEVCPSSAISRITPDDKTAISVGNANWIADNCVVNRDGLPCTACERHCPTGAITLVPLNAEEAAKDAAPAPRWGRKPAVLKIPAIDNTKCIGCGACEYLCPARPFAAIYVEGNITHHEV